MTLKQLLPALAGVLLLAGAGDVRPAGAQEVGFGAVADWNTGTDMIPVSGWAAAARLGPRRLIVFAESQAGGATRMRVPCGGLVPPGTDCTPVPTRVDLRVRGAGFGVRLPLATAGPTRFTAEPALALLVVTGLGDAVVAGRGGVELAASVRPSQRLPLMATVGTRTHVAIGFQPDCVDCAQPSYGDGFAGIGLTGRLTLLLP